MKDEPSVYSDDNNKVSHTTGTTQLQKKGSHRRFDPRTVFLSLKRRMCRKNEGFFVIQV